MRGRLWLLVWGEWVCYQTVEIYEQFYSADDDGILSTIGAFVLFLLATNADN